MEVSEEEAGAGARRHLPLSRATAPSPQDTCWTVATSSGSLMQRLSVQQETAIKAVKHWLHNGANQVFYLAGYAGTGKSTIARMVDDTRPMYAAFTGKAASVMRNKGCHDATTIHQLIYRPKIRSKARLEELLLSAEKDPDNVELKERIEAEKANLRKPSFSLNLDSPLSGASLLIVDECSMVDEQIGKDLLSFGKKILVLGDPAQLPPVYGAGFFTKGTPDFTLTEVHRQALDSPVLELATYVRENKTLPAVHQCVLNEVNSALVLKTEQLIVHYNRTRFRINARIRTLLGYDHPMPMVGDKLVCLKNNHELGLMNGALYKVLESNGDDKNLCLTIDTGQELFVQPEPFIGKSMPFWEYDPTMDRFDWGYALTCHKSQGSQWDSVGVFFEGYRFADSARWLYTAITRAAKEVWVYRT